MIKHRQEGARLLGAWLLLGAALLSAPCPAVADESKWLEPAIAAYTQGMESTERDERLRHFSDSERFFTAACQAGKGSADCWTNLGNAALQAERLGPAILAFRRALLLDPGNDRARQNLVHARSLLADWVPVPQARSVFDTFFTWQAGASPSARADWAAGFFALAAALLSLALVRELTAARYLALASGLAWLALVVSLQLDGVGRGGLEGVIVVAETPGRAADSINAPLRFGENLPSGAEIRILEDRGGWLHVELYNGRDAWISESAVARVDGADD
ncbi:MAG: hypothetical protein P8Q97_00200 [Myxococcota bacterium]|jgi:hypothetical protein|nr:hypothetical protein [Myxococcota bacterium]